jgi:hypothetical protein
MEVDERIIIYVCSRYLFGLGNMFHFLAHCSYLIRIFCDRSEIGRRGSIRFFYFEKRLSRGATQQFM